VPLVEQDAAEAERLCRQADRVVAALRETGIYAMLLPQALSAAFQRMSSRFAADSPLEGAGFEPSVPRDTTKVSGQLMSPVPDCPPMEIRLE
jgi:hypothetical protein